MEKFMKTLTMALCNVSVTLMIPECYVSIMFLFRLKIYNITVT